MAPEFVVNLKQNFFIRVTAIKQIRVIKDYKPDPALPETFTVGVTTSSGKDPEYTPVFIAKSDEEARSWIRENLMK